MFYAHTGSSTDNAFTLGIDNNPIRTFVATSTKKNRIAMQESIWSESGGKQNLIFCTRAFVEKHMGKNFYVDSAGHIWKNEYEYEIELLQDV